MASHFLKASVLIEDSFLPRTMESKLKHPSKAFFSILLMFLRTIFCRLLQPLNAFAGIAFILFPNSSTVFKFLQFSKLPLKEFSASTAVYPKVGSCVTSGPIVTFSILDSENIGLGT